VSSFLGERSSTLVFQGAPGTPAPVKVGAHQGSPISPLLLLLYVSPLHFRPPRSLMNSQVNDFALTPASRSYSGNIQRLQGLFERLQAKALRIGVSFSIAKTELIHWRTPARGTHHSASASFRSKESCSGPAARGGGSGTRSLLLLTPPLTFRAGWPSPREPSPSSDASAPPGQA